MSADQGLPLDPSLGFEDAVRDERMQVYAAWVKRVFQEIGFPPNVHEVEISLHYDDGKRLHTVLGIEDAVTGQPTTT